MDAEFRLYVNLASKNRKTSTTSTGEESPLLKKDSAVNVSQDDKQSMIRKASQLGYCMLVATHLFAIGFNIYNDITVFQHTWCKNQKGHGGFCSNFTIAELGLPRYFTSQFKLVTSLINTVLFFVFLKHNGHFYGFKVSLKKCRSQKWLLSFGLSLFLAITWDFVNTAVAIVLQNSEALQITITAFGWLMKNILDAALVISLTHYIPPSKPSKSFLLYSFTVVVYSINYLSQFAYCSVLAVFKISLVANKSQFWSMIDILLTVATSRYNKTVYDSLSTKLYKSDKDIVTSVYNPLHLQPVDSNAESD
ncbi:PREDICTED: uncharacterized protein LOC109485350 [Branchiostoma belcheri]|uniref:Uncharacterized protein LOC109485350 n=1 Tax=Branchiostoma belcheri TaxID=7741 RepID=A0A6P4ZTG3_BRABE|nr:PREDICTED: uncharacterized protein LOC109485350 [Branchiostoma belcheri]